MRKDKKTHAEIAQVIGVPQATVSKELKGNRCSNGHYSPKMLQVFADDAKWCSHKPCKLDADMRVFIVGKTERFQWSLEQIKGYCDVNGLEIVSVEWMYRLIRDNKRSGGTLYRYCRHRLKHQKRCVRHISDRVFIHQRSDRVEGRQEFGHFEMDLIQNGKDFILTVTERMTRFLLMERLVNGKNADGVAKPSLSSLSLSGNMSCPSQPIRRRVRKTQTTNNNSTNEQ